MTGAEMQVTVWNMRHGGAEAWAKLDTTGADVSLLTEAVVPADRSGVWHDKTEARDDANRPWSSAVVSHHPAAEVRDARPSWHGRTREVPFECSRPGSWAAAAVEHPAIGQVTAVALYGLMDEMSDASMHRSLSEIAPLVDDDRYSRQLLIGGDFNTGTQWSRRDRQWNDRDSNVLGRLRAWGLVDCIAKCRPSGRLEGCRCNYGDDCTHVRTRRDPRHPDFPYQVDYLFASPALADRLESCEARVTEDWFALSDHAPIVATFE